MGMPDTEKPASRAAERLVAHYGGRKQTAEALGVTRETVRLWLSGGIPLERAVEVEQVCRGVITAEQILFEARERAAA
jgi:DNA-binding transcriptional regulator YdaS (Cro superfamily)